MCFFIYTQTICLPRCELQKYIISQSVFGLSMLFLLFSICPFLILGPSYDSWFLSVIFVFPLIMQWNKTTASLKGVTYSDIYLFDENEAHFDLQN